MSSVVSKWLPPAPTRLECHSVQLTVLGKSPSWEDAGGACSGYLVEQAGFRLLLDCGSGVFSKLRRFCDYRAVDAVWITHMHGDHILDLLPFSYALTLGPHRGARPRLYLPPGGVDVLRRLVALWGDGELVPNAFEVHHYAGDQEPELGPLRARVREVPHFTRAFAVDLRADGAGRFTFSADCGPNDALIELAADTDLLLVEATLSAGEQSDGHLNARQAGEHGRRAGAHRLVLTHISDELDLDGAVDEATEGFGAPVDLAREGAVYTL